LEQLKKLAEDVFPLENASKIENFISQYLILT
jgi:hypothetical protein